MRQGEKCNTCLWSMRIETCMTSIYYLVSLYDLIVKSLIIELPLYNAWDYNNTHACIKMELKWGPYCDIHLSLEL